MTKSNYLEYQGHYSDSKFWSVLARFAGKIGRKVLFMALCLYYVMKSPGVSFKDKMVIVGALGYLILPADAIPDAIPGLGFIDDAAIIFEAYCIVRNSITPDIERQANAKLSQWF